MSLSSDGTVMTMPVQPANTNSATAGVLEATARGGLLFCSCSYFAAGAVTGVAMAALVLATALGWLTAMC